MDTGHNSAQVMKKEIWIENILNSTNGITTVTPNDNLLSKIQQRMQLDNKVPSKTVWLVAASIAVLVFINFTLLSNKAKEKKSTAIIYLERTLDKSNQLYQ